MKFKNFLIESIEDSDRWALYIKEEPMLKASVKILNRIVSHGYKAYIVGGAVRDIYLGKKPKDIDIATNMPIDEIDKIWKSHDIGKSKDFGIVVVNQDGFSFEVAQFRQDGTYSDGRRPDSVNICQDFKTDAARRDFCINSMGIDVDGNLIDHFDGKKDIKNKIIRTVGNPHDRFNEDKLRMLRAARFAARMGFEIDPETQKAIKSQAQDIVKVSPERIRDELVKMASQSGDKFADAIIMLDEVGVLEIILPEIVKMKEFKETARHHPESYAFGDGTVFDHVMWAIRQNKAKDPLINLATLFHDIGKTKTYKFDPDKNKHTYHGHDKAAKEIIDDVAKRLKLTNDEKDAIMFAALNHMKLFKTSQQNGLKPSKIVQIVNNKHWNVLKAVSLADDSSRLTLFDEKKFWETINNMEEIAEKWGDQTVGNGVLKVVDGKRVMELTGLKPSKAVGDIVVKVTEWVVDQGSKESVDNLIMKAFKQVNK